MMQLSIGNLERMDEVRGTGSVRPGPCNVAVAIYFVSRVIPEELLGYIRITIEHAGPGSWKTLEQAVLLHCVVDCL
ncbi:hypothetical protein ACV357_34605, partial [Pseudomonas aeruginosa]